MVDLTDSQLESFQVGPLPLVRHFLRRLDLEEILERHLPQPRLGRPATLSPARVLTVLVTNVLLARRPLYAVPQWLSGYLPEFLGLTADQLGCFNDDRIGRTLDLAFEANQAALVTDIVLTAIRQFAIALDQLHNDSTTVTFSGEYQGQDPSRSNKPVPWITYGFNKDHRPDLKQLVYELTVSEDGGVPIHFRTHDGNITDDQTHRDTWLTLKELVGTPDFCYVADSKLCVSETMRFIAKEGGTFLTVLPRSRAEDGWFKEYLRRYWIDWQEVRRQPNRRQKSGPDSVYEGFESPQRSKEGYRILWYKSSQKLEQDQNRRFKRLAAARTKIDALQSRKGRHRFRCEAAALEAANRILDELDVRRYLRVNVETVLFEEYKQKGPGRPGADTDYQRIDVPIIVLLVEDDAAAIAADAESDGLFPLITNSEQLTLAEALDKYKYQPFLEKRHEQLKSVLAVAPVFLKKPQRIASLLLVYFIVLLLYALIEREIRAAMKRAGLRCLPLYPEERMCKAPTADLVLAAFADHRRHCLTDAEGRLLRTFHDQLQPAARMILDLLGVDPRPYGIVS